MDYIFNRVYINLLFLPIIRCRAVWCVFAFFFAEIWRLHSIKHHHRRSSIFVNENTEDLFKRQAKKLPRSLKTGRPIVSWVKLFRIMLKNIPLIRSHESRVYETGFISVKELSSRQHVKVTISWLLSLSFVLVVTRSANG